mgnify:CR=1 FL=1
MKRFRVATWKCNACHNCEMACAFRHAVNGAPGRSRVQVNGSPDVNIPLLCLQCSDAACMKVCPTEALVRSEVTGAVEVIASRCTMCLACVAACSFGNLSADLAGGAVLKCDLCGGDPACARFCPSGALTYG